MMAQAWHELKDQLNDQQVDLVEWMAAGNRTTADAVAVGLISQSLLNKWRTGCVEEWVASYQAAKAVPTEEEINLRLARMVNRALDTMENAVAGRVQNKIAIDTAKFVVQSHLTTIKQAGSAPKSKVAMAEEELDNVLQLVKRA
jgi:hypothetical protein